MDSSFASPSLGRHIDRVSVDISAECRSPYRPIVSTDTRSTDALSTHDIVMCNVMAEILLLHTSRYHIYKTILIAK